MRRLSQPKVLAIMVCLGFSAGHFGVCHAQQAVGPAAVFLQPRFSRLTFNQDLNIFEWFYSLNYHKRLGGKLRFRVREDYRTTLQRISSKDLWKDDQNLVFNLAYPLGKKLSIESVFESHVLSDPLAGFNNNVTFHSGGGRLHYFPRPNIDLSARASSQWQTQLEQSDQGFGYGLSANVDPFDFSGYRSDLSLLGERAVFPNRTNEDVKLRYRIRRRFYESTADTLTILFDRLRRDSFDADAAGVFVRNLTQSSKGFDNRLSYKISSSAVLFVKNALMSTSFKVNNFKGEVSDLLKEDAGFESRHALRLRVQKSRWFGSLGWDFRLRTRDDKRQLDRTPDPFGRFATVGFDSEDKLVGLNALGGFAVNSSDSLGWFASVSKFQYDTSDTTNPNDHDHIRWQATFSHRHRFSTALFLIWRGSAFLNHFVFISRKFSSGNNWERIFQLTPEIVYIPAKNLYFKQSFTVRAKYQTYDFDDPETSNRNIVNRQFVLTHVSRFPLFAELQAEVNANFELAEQGRLFYNRWRQNLALSWRNQEVRLMLKKFFSPGWSVAAGGSFFNQKRWEHRINSEGVFEKKLQTSHTNWGPVAEVLYKPGGSVEILFLGNIQFVNSSRRTVNTIKNINLNLNWFF